MLLVSCAGEGEKKSAESTFAESNTAAALPDDNNVTPKDNNVTPEDDIDTPEDLNTTPEFGDVLKGAGEGFPFEYKGQVIYVGMPAEPILQQLGEPESVMELESCAFQGFDKAYFYKGFELHTFSLENKEFVLLVTFSNDSDDSVKTCEGVRIGTNTEDALNRLGDEYEENNGQYTYTKGRGSLEIITDKGKVTHITYKYVKN